MDYFTKVLHGPSSNSSSQLVELLGNVHSQVVKLEYLYFPLKLVKRQKREKKISMQRIEDGNVSFVLDFVSAEYRRQVSAVHVGVKRTNESSSSDRCIGCIPIKQIDLAYVQETKILVKVDLDSVHTFQGKKVYELDRAREELNLFHLIVDIQFINGEIMTQNTRPFKLIGRKCTGTAAGKRLVPESRTDSVESGMETSVIQAVPLVKDEESAESGYGSPSPLTSQLSSPRGTQDLIEVCTVVAEHIKTKFLDLDGESIINLNSIQKIKTPNGDIAYHFLLENENDTFEEGEVVGIVPNRNHVQKQVITKLTFETASCAVLKGVITRSHYLEAQKPASGVCSETIAMMGIVPVQVYGSVCANEALYASPNHPGFAVSVRHLDINKINEASFIGYAFSSRKADGDCSAGLVQAAVSLLQSAGFRLLQEKFHSLEQQFSKEIKYMKRSRSRTRKCICGGAVIFGVLTALIFIFLWQVLSKSSAYHYYRCKQGRKQPEGQSYFIFTSLLGQSRYPRVNGIEFTFEDLMAKTHHYDYNKFNGTGYHYYLNIDRCASSGIDYLGSSMDAKPIHGPDVFAMDKECLHVYYYRESEQKQKWIKYNSVSSKNICCTTSSKWQSNRTRNKLDET